MPAPYLLPALKLQGDFSANLKLLQSFPPVDVRIVLRIAEQLRSL